MAGPLLPQPDSARSYFVQKEWNIEWILRGQGMRHQAARASPYTSFPIRWALPTGLEGWLPTAGVAQAAVAAQPVPPSMNKRLVAYVTPASLDIAAVKEYCRCVEWGPRQQMSASIDLHTCIH